MTVENYNYRTSQIMLRNQFPGKGKFQIPIIPKFQEKPGDFDDLLLIGFDKTHLEDQEHLDRHVLGNGPCDATVQCIPQSLVRCILGQQRNPGYSNGQLGRRINLRCLL